MTDGPTSSPKLVHAAVRTRPNSSKTLALYKSCTYLLTYLLEIAPGETFRENLFNVNSSAPDCSISLKFGVWVQ